MIGLEVKKLNGKIRSLHSYKEIKKIFKDALNYDIYDYRTMEYFIRKNLSEFSNRDFKTMLDTIERDKITGQTIISFGSNIYNSIIALLAIIAATFVAFMVVLITFLMDKGELAVVNNITYLLKGTSIIVFLLAVLISIYFILMMRNIKIRDTLQTVIKIVMEIKIRQRI